MRSQPPRGRHNAGQPRQRVWKVPAMPLEFGGFAVSAAETLNPKPYTLNPKP